MVYLERLGECTFTESLYFHCFIRVERGNLLQGSHGKLQLYVIHLTNTAGASKAESIVPATNQREREGVGERERGRE
jgi:hypothetical protein